MPFRPLPYELELSDYSKPRVQTDSSRWNSRRGQRMSAHSHNKIDAREGYTHYRCGIYNDTNHKRKTCLNREHMYDKTYICYDIL